MIHQMKLNTEPYELIRSRTKDIEMRLLDAKRKKVSIGDFIIFTSIDTGEELKTKVLNLFFYKNFKDLYRGFDKKRLGYSEEQEANFADMEYYYKKEDIEKYGVVAMEITLIK